MTAWPAELETVGAAPDHDRALLERSGSRPASVAEVKAP
jgi:hypothetical protein